MNSIEDQRLGLDLAARHSDYSERRRAQARALDDAEKRLGARSYFEEQEAIRQNAEAALSRLQV